MLDGTAFPIYHVESSVDSRLFSEPTRATHARAKTILSSPRHRADVNKRAKQANEIIVNDPFHPDYAALRVATSTKDPTSNGRPRSKYIVHFISS